MHVGSSKGHFNNTHKGSFGRVKQTFIVVDAYNDTGCCEEMQGQFCFLSHDIWLLKKLRDCAQWLGTLWASINNQYHEGKGD